MFVYQVTSTKKMTISGTSIKTKHLCNIQSYQIIDLKKIFFKIFKKKHDINIFRLKCLKIFFNCTTNACALRSQATGEKRQKSYL